MTRLRVVHETVYEYDEPVTTSHHEIHLAPRDSPRQDCLSHDLLIVPTPGVWRERIDFFGNRASYFGIHESHRSLRIVATSEVRLKGHPESPLWSPRWEEVRDLVANDRRPETLAAYEFAFDSPYVKAHADLRDFALPSFPKGRPLLEAMVDLTKRIYTQFKHDPTATQISTPLAEVLRLRRGVCQIFPTSRSVVFVRWGSPGATSAAICLRSRPPVNRGWSGPTPRTPGFLPISPTSGGSISILRTMRCPLKIMSRLALGATLATSLRYAASSSEGAPIITLRVAVDVVRVEDSGTAR